MAEPRAQTQHAAGQGEERQYEEKPHHEEQPVPDLEAPWGEDMLVNNDDFIASTDLDELDEIDNESDVIDDETSDSISDKEEDS